MSQVYLFDWGDTLMVDDPSQSGKMRHWDQVQALPGAAKTLACLSQHSRIYVASGAKDSSSDDIRAALERVGLASYISGYFCPATLGLAKGQPDFLPAILDQLALSPGQVAMVGDSLEKDIRPALAAGISAVWLTTQTNSEVPAGVRQIRQLDELCR